MTDEVADLERAVADYLRDNDVRSVALPPSESSRASSWVRVSQLAMGDGGDSERVIDGMLQFDCYAGKTGGQPEATALGRRVRALLKDLQGTVTNDVAFGRVHIIGHVRIPDTDKSFEPARERVILTVSIVHHVVEVAS